MHALGVAGERHYPPADETLYYTPFPRYLKASFALDKLDAAKHDTRDSYLHVTLSSLIILCTTFFGVLFLRTKAYSTCQPL